jgi:RNA polymerase sigma-70 factor (ECF subfamily)
MDTAGNIEAMDERADPEVIAASLVRPVEFAAIFDRHYATVHRYAARRLGAQLADDVAAQTFEEALRSRHRFDVAQASARPWLLGIATNLIRHHFRTEHRRLTAVARLAADPDTADHAAAIPGRVDAELAAPLLRAVVAALPAGERDVLLLFAWADLSYDEIAAALHIPPGTVRSRLNRARTRLREQLRRSGQYVGDGPTRSELVHADG